MSQIFFRRTNFRWGRIVDNRRVDSNGRSLCQVTRKPDNGHPFAGDSRLYGRLEHTWKLCGSSGYFIIITAIVKKFDGIRLLKIFRTELSGGNCRGDGDYRCAGSVCVIQAVNQMNMSRPATSRAASRATGQLCFCRSGIRPCFFVAHMYPFYLIVFSDCFVYFIQTVACYGVDAFNSGFYQSIYQLFCYFFCHSCNWFRIDFYVITDGCKEKF